MENPLTYYSTQLAHSDRERYACALLAPAERQKGVIALLAWNSEIAHVGENVTEEMLGFIRFAWWREGLEALYEGLPPRPHGAVTLLAETIRQYHLPQQPFQDMLAAREADLQPTPFTTLEALETYAAQTSGLLLEQWLRVLDIAETESSAHKAAQHIGTAWGITGIIRSIHAQAHRNRMCLPLEMLETADCKVEEVLTGSHTPALASVIETLAARAQHHLKQARALRKEIPQQAFPPLYLATLADDFLARIRQSGSNPFSPLSETGRGKRAFTLWLKALAQRPF